jgi:hypothetical protein
MIYVMSSAVYVLTRVGSQSVALASVALGEGSQEDALVHIRSCLVG